MVSKNSNATSSQAELVAGQILYNDKTEVLGIYRGNNEVTTTWNESVPLNSTNPMYSGNSEWQPYYGTTTYTSVPFPPNTITTSGTTLGTAIGSGFSKATEATFIEYLAPHGWKRLNEDEKNFSDVALVCDVCDVMLLQQSFGLGACGDHTIELMIEDAKQRLEEHSKNCKGVDDVAE